MSKRSKQANKRCLDIIRNYFNNGAWLDTVFEHEDNPDKLSHIDYMHLRFMEQFYHDSKKKETKMMRLAPLFCRLAFECGFQQAMPDDKKLLRLERLMNHMDEKANTEDFDLTSIDVSSTTFDDLEQKFGKELDEALRVEEEKLFSENCEGVGKYTLVGPLSFEEASLYKEYTTICYLKDLPQYKQYTNDGTYKLYILLCEGYKDVQFPQKCLSAYDDYGLSLISFIVDECGELIYCNVRYNHGGVYERKGCSCDHALSKLDLCQLYGNKLKTLFNDKFYDLTVQTIKESAVMGVYDLCQIFKNVFTLPSGIQIISFKGRYNFAKGNHILYNEWFRDCTVNINNNYICYVRDIKQHVNIFKDEKFLFDHWYDEIAYLSGDLIGLRTENLFKFYNVSHERFVTDREFLIDNDEIRCTPLIVHDYNGRYNVITDYGLLFERDYDYIKRITINIYSATYALYNNGEITIYSYSKNVFDKHVYHEIRKNINDFSYIIVYNKELGYKMLSSFDLSPILGETYDYIGNFTRPLLLVRNKKGQYNYVVLYYDRARHNEHYLFNEWYDNATEFHQIIDKKDVIYKASVCKDGVWKDIYVNENGVLINR